MNTDGKERKVLYELQHVLGVLRHTPSQQRSQCRSEPYDGIQPSGRLDSRLVAFRKHADGEEFGSLVPCSHEEYVFKEFNIINCRIDWKTEDKLGLRQ